MSAKLLLTANVCGSIAERHVRFKQILLPLPGPSEAESFQLEMSGLLSELACPYAVLTSGDITQRLLNRTDCLLLLSMTLHYFCNISI